METSFNVESFDVERTKKEQWLEQWGDFAAETLRDPSYQFFSTPHINGMIGFKELVGCAITFGDPICAKEDAPELAKAFHSYCQSKNLNVGYMISSEEFSKWAANHLCQVLIEVGEELVFDPQNDPLEGPRNKLRNKVNHAQHIGLIVEEYANHDPNLEKKIQSVGNQWLKSRTGPQIYLADVDFFRNRQNRRWFYVKDPEGQILGVALLTRIQLREGWFLKFLITVPDAPRGTSEWLMVSILEVLRKENCHYLTYGLIPAEELGDLMGIGACSEWIVKKLFKLAKKFFSLENRKGYWGQFHPVSKRSYILFEKLSLGIREIRAVLKSLKVEF